MEKIKNSKNINTKKNLLSTTLNNNIIKIMKIKIQF